MIRTMRHIALIFLILPLVLFTTTTQAHSIYLSKSDDVCENDDNLPKGLSYTEYTPDCEYTEGLTVITNGQRFGFADRHGKVVIKPTFEEAYGFDEGLALIKQKGKYGYIDPTGKTVILPTFENAWGFWEERAKIYQNGKYGFIDKTGQIVIEPIYDEAGHWFAEGLVSAKMGDKYGFIDKTGNVAIEPTYDYVADFSEGLAVVGKNTGQTDEYDQPKYRYGYINKHGKIALPIKYDFATPFIEGIASVEQNTNLYFIDHQGKKVNF